MQNKDIVARLLAFIKPYRGRAALSFLMMAGTATTEPLFAYAMEQLMDKGFGDHKVAFNLWLVPLILLSIFIARGIFTSRHDLKRKIMRYIRQYNTSAKPVKWKYADPRHRITATLPVTSH